MVRLLNRTAGRVSRRRRGRLAGLLVVLIGLMLTGGLYSAFAPASAERTESTDELVAQGRELFLVGCSTCHGRIDLQPLTYQVPSLQMEWCLDCHKTPEKYVRPKSEVFNIDYQPPANQLELGRRLVKEYGIKTRIPCSTCHR